MGSFPLRFAVVASLLAALLMPVGFGSRCCCSVPPSVADRNQAETALSAALASLRPCCRARLAAELERANASRRKEHAHCQVAAAPRSVAGCHCQSNARIAQTAVASRIDAGAAKHLASAPVLMELPIVVASAPRVASALPQPRSLSPATVRARLCRWVV